MIEKIIDLLWRRERYKNSKHYVSSDRNNPLVDLDDINNAIKYNIAEPIRIDRKWGYIWLTTIVLLILIGVFSFILAVFR